jgi:predicted MarR family transcription regulator
MTIKKKTANKSNPNYSALDKHWHLALDDSEIQLAELEYALYRVYAAFERWQSDCVAAVANLPMSSTENTVLHVIRMKDRPKTISEIGRLLNRDDIPNLQYAIRKLLGAKLIEKHRGNKKKGICYKATKYGEQVTDGYAEIRRNLLLPLVESVHNWDTLAESTCLTLDLLKGIYDSAALTVSAHRRPASDSEE